jgi:hypothetical protein
MVGARTAKKKSVELPSTRRSRSWPNIRRKVEIVTGEKSRNLLPSRL